MALLLVFGVGLTLPFVLAAAFIKPFLHFISRFRAHLSKVEKEMKLPTVDPVLTGTKRLADELANF